MATSPGKPSVALLEYEAVSVRQKLQFSLTVSPNHESLHTADEDKQNVE